MKIFNIKISIFSMNDIFSQIICCHNDFKYNQGMITLHDNWVTVE